MLTKNEIFEVLKKLDREKYGIKKIGIFGSYAKDEASEESDVDIIVDLEDRDDYFENLCELKRYLSSLFKTKVDIISEEAIKNVERQYINERVRTHKKKIKEEILSSVIYA